LESDGRLRGVGGLRARCRQKKNQERGDGTICASVRRREAMRCSAIKMRYEQRGGRAKSARHCELRGRLGKWRDRGWMRWW